MLQLELGRMAERSTSQGKTGCTLEKTGSFPSGNCRALASGPADQLTGVRDTGTAGAQLAQTRQDSDQDSEDCPSSYREL